MYRATKFFRSTTPVWLLMAVLVALPLAVGPYALSNLRDVALHALFAVSVSFLWRTGLTTFGHSVFFGSGAYITTISAMHFKTHGLAAVLAGVIISTILAFLFGLMLLYRGLRDTTFTVSTLALTMMFFLLVRGLEPTGRDSGLAGVPGFQLGSLSTSQPVVGYYVSVIALIVPVVVLTSLCNGKFGLLLVALRDNEERLRALGCNTDLRVVTIFTFSATLAAIAGSLYSSMNGVATPDMVSPALSTEVLVLAALGGKNTYIGPAIAAYLMWQLQQRMISWHPLLWPLAIGSLVIILVKLNAGFIETATSSRNNGSKS